MNDTTKLIISLFANLTGGILKKRINDRYENSMFSYQLYNLFVSLSAFAVLLLLADNFSVSAYTIILAFIFGVVTLLQQITNLLALQNGPFSYTTVIISLSTLIPTVSGKIFWDEHIAPVQYVGILLLIVCFILSVDTKKGDKKANAKWLIYSVLAFLCTGLIGIMQKVHQTSVHRNELDSFLVISFFFSFICSLILSFIFYSKRQISATERSVTSILPIMLMVISGIFVAVNNKFNLYLSGVLDSAVFFPVVNGGGLVLTSVAAVVLFKEKLTMKQWIGIITGIIAVILICNPF